MYVLRNNYLIIYHTYKGVPYMKLYSGEALKLGKDKIENGVKMSFDEITSTVFC